MTMQQRRRQADQESHRLFYLRPSGQLEILLEGHSTGKEIDQCCAHAQRGDSDGRNPLAGAKSEDRLTRLESEGVQAINIDIDAFEKSREISTIDPVPI